MFSDLRQSRSLHVVLILTGTQTVVFFVLLKVDAFYLAFLSLYALWIRNIFELVENA